MCLVSPHKEFLKKKFKQERDAMEKKYVNVKNDITVGSYVYVVKPKKVFSRGFRPTWYEKPRKVLACLNTAPKCYKLANFPRSVYRSEIAPTSEPGIEREKFFYIAKERKIGGKQLRSQAKVGQEIQYLIKSYSDKSFEEWVSKLELNRLKNEGFLCNFDEWFESGKISK